MPCTIPLDTQQQVLSFAEQSLDMELSLQNHVLFPNSVFIADNTFSNDDNYEEKFLLIFDVKLNGYGQKVGNIRYFQLPQHLRHQGLAKKIFYMLEKRFKILGCEMICIDATKDPYDQDHNTIEFWEHLGFEYSFTCSIDDNTCPMVKKI